MRRGGGTENLGPMIAPQLMQRAAGDRPVGDDALLVLTIDNFPGLSDAGGCIRQPPAVQPFQRAPTPWALHVERLEGEGSRHADQAIIRQISKDSRQR